MAFALDAKRRTSLDKLDQLTAAGARVAWTSAMASGAGALTNGKDCIMSLKSNGAGCERWGSSRGWMGGDLGESDRQLSTDT